jgi:hypothetical protein
MEPDRFTPLPPVDATGATQRSLQPLHNAALFGKTNSGTSFAAAVCRHGVERMAAHPELRIAQQARRARHARGTRGS